MSTSIEQLTTQQLHRPAVISTVQKELGLDRVRASVALDTAAAQVTGVFRQLSSDGPGSTVLYEHVRSATDETAQSLLHDNRRQAAVINANGLLQTIAGAERRSQLVEHVSSNAGLSPAQADVALAFASTGVITALRSKLAVTPDNDHPDGLAALLAWQSPGASAAGTQDGAAAAVVDAGESDNDWWSRYALPLMLLALLLLSTLTFCSESKKRKGLVVENDQLQQALGTAQADVTARTRSMNTLESDLSLAQQRLEETTQSAGAELETLRAENNSVKGQLADTQTLSLQYKRDLGTLQSAHETALAELDNFRGLPTDTLALQQRMREAITERDDARQQQSALDASWQQAKADLQSAEQVNATLETDLDDLRLRLEASTQTVAELTSQAEVLVSERDAVATELESTQTLLEQAQQQREDLSASAAGLEMRLGDAMPRLAALSNEVKTLTDENAALETARQTADDALAQARASQTARDEQYSEVRAQLQDQLDQAVEARTTAENKLGEQRQLIDESKVTIADLQERVEALQGAEITAAEQLQSLNEQVSAAQADSLRASAKIDSLTGAVSAREEELGAVSKSLDAAEQQLTSLTDERDALRRKRDELTLEIERLSTDNQTLTERLDTLVQERGALDDALTESGAQREQLSSEVAALQQTLDTTTATLDQTTDRTQSTQSELQQAKDEIVALRSEQQGAIEQINTLEETVSAKDDALAAAAEEQQTADRTIESLQQANERLQQAQQRSSEQAATTIAALRQSLADADGRLGALTTAVESVKTELSEVNDESIAATRETQEIRSEIEAQLTAAGVSGVTVQSIEGDRAVAITVGPGNLYRKGAVSLSREGTVVLKKIGDVLSAYPEWWVDVEGHTDSTPIGYALSRTYPSNWELSSARASAVVNYLSLATDMKPASMSARGYADTVPLASNEDEAGREKNRRVDIVMRRR